MTSDTAAMLTQRHLNTLVVEAQQMLEYIARHGELSVEPRLASGIYRAASRLHSEQWRAEDTAHLLQCYDQLARQIYPVTLESLMAVRPTHASVMQEATLSQHPVASAKKNRRIVGRRFCHETVAILPSGSANNVITWYRRYTVLTLLGLLGLQMFSLFGHAITTAFTDMPSPHVWSAEHHAHFQLLVQWNDIWQLQGIRGNIVELISAVMSSGETTPEPASSLRLAEASSSVDPVQFSKEFIAAKTVLQTVQNSLLPLMYGLLGALIFVLRSLLNQVRSLTYTASREVGYRLRITLGCLAGMITGWLMKPELGELALSPMALAFLSGYSIEVLFTLLDRLIDQVRRTPPTNARLPR
ncbi:hypothetical protein HGP28_03500 [Vibrio sp. SM6]|uniref:Uncharacterized protein n=1 Tax=Vibrio agarilyticus TaxID=2726741 RepID=A0A7X8TNS6_9VIBR|nr:hypothetical protein [Vibrio agarilyticus]NLS11955.1 hypothetical protein [Vibrio agarilyticus]